MLSGGIVSIIGLIFIIVSFLIINKFTQQIVGSVIGGIIAFIGMILDLTGEIILAKNYKEYNK